MITFILGMLAGGTLAIVLMAVLIVAGGYGEELRTGERDKRRP